MATNLPPGSYYVVFDRATLPAGFTITTPNVGADDAVDSDASISSGQTAPTPFLLSGTQDLTLDMGVLQPQGVRVGDYVWIDANLNGQQDAGEVGVPNVTVRLFNADGDAQVGVATQTDSSGFYLFADLPPGSYYVVFDLSTLPAGFQVTTQNANGVSDALDSDASPTTGRTANTPFLNEGEEDLSLDMGVYALLSLGNLVWVDEGADGNPNDPLFNNGLYDAGVEGGLTSTVVSLYKISDTLNVTDTSTLTGTLVSTMTTDDNGNYRFNGLLPGQYFVQIVVSDGYVSSTGRPPGPNAPYEPAPDPDNNIDNDDNGTGTANPSVIRTLPVSLSIGDEPAEGGNYNPTVDFGVCRGCAREQSFATIGDFVWLDQNCDGVQDVNSAPVPNVTVRLFKATGELVGTQLTNAQGKYLFTDLEPGQYIVEFVRPAQYIFAPSKQGSNIQLDSDAVPVATGSTVARTATIELVPLETDLSWDAGLCQPTSLPPSDEPSLNGSIFLPFVRR